MSSSETIQAIAGANGYANSNIATASYIANLPVSSPPSFSVAPGIYTSSQTVAISDATPGAAIYYAIGAESTAAFNVDSGPVKVASSKTLQAFAVADGYLNSDAVTAAYNIQPTPSSGAWAWMGGSSMVPGTCPGSTA